MTAAIYLIRNQQGQYWTRGGDWVDGREPQRPMKFRHRDEAVNQLVELSAKDIDLRGEILELSLNDGEPKLEISRVQTPLLAELAAERARAAAEAAQDQQLQESQIEEPEAQPEV